MAWQHSRCTGTASPREAVVCQHSRHLLTGRSLAMASMNVMAKHKHPHISRRESHRGGLHVSFQQQERAGHLTCKAEVDDSESTTSSSNSRDSTGNQNVSILGMTSGKGMSMQQRKRALQIYFHTWITKVVQQVPLLKSIADWTKTTIITPFAVYNGKFNEWKDNKIADYEQYLAEETKDRWSWEKRHRQEMALLQSIPPYIGMVLATLLYQTFVPLSISCAIVLPLYCSWVLYDRWWTSPILLGMIFISPWKFLVPGTWSFIWPTIC